MTNSLKQYTNRLYFLGQAKMNTLMIGLMNYFIGPISIFLAFSFMLIYPYYEKISILDLNLLHPKSTS